MNTIRGIECALIGNALSHVLQFLAYEKCEFYVPWCTMIDMPGMAIPRTIKDQHINAQYLRRIADQSVWELVLKLYPLDKLEEAITTYDDYEGSECICYLIYYDCGMLDIYAKDLCLIERLHKLLSDLGVQSLRFLTRENDCRTRMYP